MAKNATRVHILNGNEGIGASSTIIEVCNERILLDAGIKMGGVEGDHECAFANLDDYLSYSSRAAKKPISAIVLTHKHADHIDALINYARLGYVLPRVMASSETVDFLRLQFAKEPLLKAPEFVKVKAGRGGALNLGKHFNIEAIAVPHATKGAYAYHIQTKIDGVKDAGLLHLGDFNTRQELNSDRDFLADFRAFVKGKKIDAFFVDSTSSSNKREDIRSSNEQTQNIVSVFKKQSAKRVIATAISRSDNNIESILSAAMQTDKKVFLVGDGLRDTYKTMLMNGHNEYKDAVFHSKNVTEFKELPLGKQVVVAAGALGDGHNKNKQSSLTKIVNGRHLFFDVDDKTTMCYFQREIPAVDTLGQIAKQKDICREKGAEVIETINGEYLESGHATKKELEAIAKIIKKENPRAVCIPTHGTQDQLSDTQNVFDETGLSTEVFKNGAVVAVYDGYLVPERKEVLNAIGVKEKLTGNGSSIITFDELNPDGSIIREILKYNKEPAKFGKATLEDVKSLNTHKEERATSAYEKVLSELKQRCKGR